MTRKDYILLANELKLLFELSREERGETLANYSTEFLNGRDAALLQVSHNLASALGSDNPRFDREHFLAVVRGEKDLNSRPTRKAVRR